jgi:hypothetical protein
MSGIATLFGGGSDAGAKIAQQQAAAAQRRAIAEMARQAAEADQAKSSGGKRKGRSLLTFLGAEGQATLG